MTHAGAVGLRDRVGYERAPADQREVPPDAEQQQGRRQHRCVVCLGEGRQDPGNREQEAAEGDDREPADPVAQSP